MFCDAVELQAETPEVRGVALTQTNHHQVTLGESAAGQNIQFSFRCDS
jgi:hypothetical protein